jgi:hypothetical protein
MEEIGLQREQNLALDPSADPTRSVTQHRPFDRLWRRQIGVVAEDMRVDAQRDRRRAVAEAPAYGVDIEAGGETQARGGLLQTVFDTQFVAVQVGRAPRPWKGQSSSSQSRYCPGWLIRR